MHLVHRVYTHINLTFEDSLVTVNLTLSPVFRSIVRKIAKIQILAVNSHVDYASVFLTIYVDEVNLILRNFG